MIICGREITSETLEALQARAGTVSLRKLARWLCERLQWVGASGVLQVGLGLSVLGKLREKKLLDVPVGPSPIPAHRSRAEAVSAEEDSLPAIVGSLPEVGPIELVRINSRYSKHYRLWKGMLQGHHYLGMKGLFGHQIKYLIRCPQGWLGALAFGAPALAVEARDRWIGWSSEARRENLYQLINNSRFLILPQVQVPHLASHVLAKALALVPEDWQQRYGYRPVLVETYVEKGRYSGICYSAANWQAVGITTGRGRQDAEHRQTLPQKVLWVYPLSKEFRQRLCALPEKRRLAQRPARQKPAAVESSDWHQQEFGACPLADRRLERRLQTIARDFGAHPQMSIPQACASRAKTKAVYRFLDHPRVNLHSILEGHYEATRHRAGQQKVVLAVQDTTDLNYTAHPQTEGMGPICDKKGVIGMLVHDTMAYTLEGTPLGLLDVQCWRRDPEQTGKRAQRHQLAFEEKESSKWLASFRSAQRLQKQCPQTLVVSVGDREADLYELFVEAQAQAEGPKLLVRAQQQRKIHSPDPDQETQALWEHVEGLPAAGILTMELPRRAKRAGRTAELEVRFAEVQLRPPQRKKSLGPVRVWAISAREKNPPADVEPVEWLLLTTVAVQDFHQAVEKLQWYALRFQIEVYHRTLKSGCKIEDRQLGNAERIEGCLGIDMVVAWRIVHLTKLGREMPEVPCTVFFEEAQWKALVAYATDDPDPPLQPPTLREAIRMMAMRLGGFLGRKSEGEPGAETIWRGLQRLDDLTAMWCVMQKKSWTSPTDRELLNSS